MEQPAREDGRIKLALVGDQGVGKTCLVARFTEDEFHLNYQMTMGVHFKNKTVAVGLKNITLHIWDTAGQERFNSITRHYLRGARGILLVYDIAHQPSFDHVFKWLGLIEQFADDDAEKVLIGNKCDVYEERQVPTGIGEAVAQQHGMTFLETSAKAKINVEEAFMTLAKTVMEKDATRTPVPRGIVLKPQDKQKKTCPICNILN